MTRPLIQIVPRRSIHPEGVGDYSRLVAENLLARHDIRTTFVTGTPLPADERLHDDWTTLEISRRRRADLLDLLDVAAGGASPSILLHLSGYGFQRKGTPLWLASALETWRKHNPHVPLLTIFHELFATGPIWSSPFWLGPTQAKVARRIQAISTAGIATTSLYTETLDGWSQGTVPPTITLPVFSNVGETTAIVPSAQRAPSLVIFGRSEVYAPVYQAGRSTLEAFVAAHDITEIIDIGRRDLPPPATIGTARVRALGQIPPEPLQAELAKARFGLLDYDADRLAKSTIFASYCAHGTIPVCLTDSEGNRDGLKAGENYIRLVRHESPRGVPELPPLAELQRGAVSWYAQHSSGAAADLIADILYPDTV